MLYDKPDWVAHEGREIFSVDISECPKGPRLATAGGDHKVRVWNLAAVLDARVEQLSAPRLLATLDHLEAINVVRFSHDGRYLASGSDDGKVLLFELRAGAGTTTFGSRDAPSLENWKQTRSFTEHSINVTDLAWAPSGFTLATCSIDNRIVVWDASTGRQLAILTAHSSHVKGLAWDPSSKYLASLSDDKSLIIWLTENWAPVATITQPFKKAAADTWGLRFSWSPDGAMLMAVNSLNHVGHCAPVLARNAWSNERQFQGHVAPVVVAKCSSKLYFAAADVQRQQPLSCVALGSKDGSLSIWSTQQAKKPIAALTGGFTQGIVDIAWTPDGYSLIACSTDGSLLTIRMEPEELGKCLSPAEMAAHMDGVYGDDRKQPGYVLPEYDWHTDNGQADDDSDEDMQQAARPHQANGHAANGHAAPASQPAAAQPNTSASVPPANHPPPATAPAAKRRLAPMPMPSAPAASHPAFNPLAPASKPTPPAAASESPQTSVPPASAATAEPEAQPAATRKRLAPMELARPGKRPSPPAAQAAAAPGAPAAGATAARPPLAKPAGNAARQGGAGLPVAPASGLKDRMEPAGSTGVAHSFAAPAQQAVPLPSSPAQIQAAAAQRVVAAQGSIPDRLGAVIPPDPVAASLLGPQQQPQRTLEVSNANGEAVLTMRQNGTKVWHFRTTGQATKLVATSSFVALGLRSGILQVLSPMGRVLLPPLQLGAAPAFLVAHSHRPSRLLAVSTTGVLRQWDVACWQRCGCDCLAPSVADLLTEGQTVRRMELTEGGAPLARLSDGMVWLLHAQLQAWLLVAGNESPAAAFASLHVPPVLGTGGLGEGQGELARLQARALQAHSSGQQALQACAAALSKGPADTQQHHRADCEMKLAQARAVGSPEEFRRWLVTYSRLLARDADEARLRELSEELLAGAGSAAEGTQIQAGSLQASSGHVLLGWDRRKLFSRSVLSEMRHAKGTHPLAAEYRDRIEHVT